MSAMIKKIKATGLKKVEVNVHRGEPKGHVDDAVSKILANRMAIADSSSEDDFDDSGSDFTSDDD